MAGLAAALLASCNDESVAGTSDEARLEEDDAEGVRWRYRMRDRPVESTVYNTSESVKRILPIP